jgi:beta-carotene 15,15'-dioxygenase
MLQIAMLLLGFLLLLVQYYFQPFTSAHQLFFFLAGIIILGVPHGAADLLVAMQNAGSGKNSFSKYRFFKTYLGRLVLFASALYFYCLSYLLLTILAKPTFIIVKQTALPGRC